MTDTPYCCSSLSRPPNLCPAVRDQNNYLSSAKSKIWYRYLIHVICWSCLVGFYPLHLYSYKTIWSWSCCLFYKSCSSKLLLALYFCWVVTDSSPNPFLQNMDFMHCWCFKREIHCLLKGKNSQTLKTCYPCLTLLDLGEALHLKFTGQKLMLKELWRVYPTKHLSDCKATSQTWYWLRYLLLVESLHSFVQLFQCWSEEALHTHGRHNGINLWLHSKNYVVPSS